MCGDDLEGKILEAIERTGYPLELRVSEELEELDYFVANNLYFVDKDENKGREIDIRGLKNYSFKEGGSEYFVRHCLMIECKKSISKPWVIFTSPQNPYDKELSELECRGVKKGRQWHSPELLMELEKFHPFKVHPRRGRTFFEAFKGESAETSGTIFKSLTTAVKATIAMRSEEFAAGKNSVCFYYPIVIFEGRLFEAYLENGKVIIKEVDSIMVSFFYQSANYPDESLIVPVVKPGALGDLCLNLNSALQVCGDFLKRDPSPFDW